MIACVVVVAWWGPSRAEAGTYVVEACRTTNAPAPNTSWTAAPIPEGGSAPPQLLTDTCESGGFVDFRVIDLSDGLQGVRWSFRAPAGATVAAVSLDRYARNLVEELDRVYQLRAGNEVLERSPDQPPWTLGNADATDGVTVMGLRAPGLDLEFRCVDEADGCSGDGAFLRVGRAAVTVRDEAPPEVMGLPAGGLTAGRSLDGIVDFRLGFKDVGGGVAAVELSVDGLTRSITPVGGPNCATPYVVTTPCASEGHVTLTLDTDELADGAHTVEAVLIDVAGNRSVVGPFGISVRTPAAPPMVGPPLSPAPAASTVSTPAGVLSLSGSSTRRTSYKAVTVKGTVKAPGGAGVGGARVGLSSRPLTSSAWSDATVTTADAKGNFVISVPPGPSRELRVAYGESIKTIKLIVAAPVRLRTNRKTTRNGRSIKFSGSIPGAGDARTRVELQAWAGRWVPFKTAALRNGRFSATYRFTATYSKTRYRFRAVVHDDDDFPYAGGRSPEVKVVVSP